MNRVLRGLRERAEWLLLLGSALAVGLAFQLLADWLECHGWPIRK